ncbi:hypothetical protein GCM10020255_015890 [Rhodococcus baikonurensis]
MPADRAFALAGIDRTTDILATTMSCAGAMSAVAAFFTQLAQHQDSDPHGAAQLETHASSLATSLLSLVTPVRSAAEIPAFLRRDQVLAYIHAHLADPDLDAERIATAMRLSRRSLYRLFQGTDHTVMDISAQRASSPPSTYYENTLPGPSPSSLDKQDSPTPHLLPSVPRHHRHDTQRTPRTPRLTTHCTYPLYSSTRPPDGSTTTGSGESWPAYDRWPET